MSANPYKIAFERERQARKIAEKMLDEKTREVYSTLTMIKSQYEHLEAERFNLEQANATLRATQRQLIQSEKMASIGQLAAGVAHEINNPVGFVQSNLQTLVDYVRSYEQIINTACSEIPVGNTALTEVMEVEDYSYIKSDVQMLLSESITGLQRVKEIVTGLNSFARVSDSKKEPVNINQLLEDTVKVVWNELKYVARICFDLHEIPLIHCNRGQISQVIVNLLVNASHAMNGCGREGHIELSTALEGDTLRIEVKDNGKGIPEDIKERIFEPFFTTKPVGVGTGLGLSVSHGIIEKHRGQISVFSCVNEGTAFTILLPCSDAEILPAVVSAGI